MYILWQEIKKKFLVLETIPLAHRHLRIPFPLKDEVEMGEAHGDNDLLAPVEGSCLIDGNQISFALAADKGLLIDLTFDIKNSVASGD